MSRLSSMPRSENSLPNSLAAQGLVVMENPSTAPVPTMAFGSCANQAGCSLRVNPPVVLLLVLIIVVIVIVIVIIVVVVLVEAEIA